MLLSAASRGITVTQPEVLTVSEGRDVTIECKTDAGIDGWGLAWYQQKPGETPKLVIYTVNSRYGNSFSRFSGNGAYGGTDFTLTIIQTEDAGHYYCQSRHDISGTSPPINVIHIWILTFTTLCFEVILLSVIWDLGIFNKS
uniref:Ig-like domain-containing protein n=1 Tax=Cyprinus carpio carpio TaxID=630221 RepID=A0A8C1AXN8_CYPCA